MKPMSLVVKHTIVGAFALGLTTTFIGERASAAGPAEAGSRASDASAATLSLAGGVVVVGTLSTLVLAGQAAISSVRVVGESVVVVLEGADHAARATVRLSGRAVEGSGAVVGGTVMLSAYATGTLLRCGGRVIGFIPNDEGRALIRSRALNARPAV